MSMSLRHSYKVLKEHSRIYNDRVFLQRILETQSGIGFISMSLNLRYSFFIIEFYNFVWTNKFFEYSILVKFYASITI